MEAIPRRLQEHRGSKQPASSLWSYLCFGLMAMKTHEDRIVGMYTPGCTRHQYHHAGCTDVDPSMDRCSCYSFGLLESGCSCVRPQWGEEHCKCATESWRQLFKSTLKCCYKKDEALPMTDEIHGLWNYEPMRILCAVIIRSASLQACVMLNYFTFTSGICFWQYFFLFTWSIILEHTTSIDKDTRLTSWIYFPFRHQLT